MLHIIAICKSINGCPKNDLLKTLQNTDFEKDGGKYTELFWIVKIQLQTKVGH